MSIKNFFLSLMLSSAMLNPVFAMDQDSKEPGGGVKRLLEDKKDKKNSKKPRVDLSAQYTIEEKPTVQSFYCELVKTIVDKNKNIVNGGRDEVGPLHIFPEELFFKILSYSSRKDLMGINSTFYTLTMLYRKENILSRGCGRSTMPDFVDQYELFTTEGIYKKSGKVFKAKDPKTNERFTPSTLYSSTWHILLKSVTGLPTKYYEYLPYSQIEDFNYFHPKADWDQALSKLCGVLPYTSIKFLDLSDDDLFRKEDLKILRKGLPGSKVEDLSVNHDGENLELEDMLKFYRVFKDTNIHSLHDEYTFHTAQGILDVIKAFAGSKVKKYEFVDTQLNTPTAQSRAKQIAENLGATQIEILCFTGCNLSVDFLKEFITTLRESQNTSLKELQILNWTNAEGQKTIDEFYKGFLKVSFDPTEVVNNIAAALPQESSAAEEAEDSESEDTEEHDSEKVEDSGSRTNDDSEESLAAFFEEHGHDLDDF